MNDVMIFKEKKKVKNVNFNRVYYKFIQFHEEEIKIRK